MGIKETITGALDADGDGKVSAKEVFDAARDRVIETKDAAVEAAESVKEGFDADGNGSVSFDEVKEVAKAAAGAAEAKVDPAMGKIADKVEAGVGKVIDAAEAASEKL